MSITSRLAKAGAITLFGAAALGLGSGSAFAGGNGQQINFHDRLGTVYSVSIAGSNQNGQYVEGCFSTPSVDNYLSGWWWKGYVAVGGYTDGNCGKSGGRLILTNPAAGPVPEYQANSDWYTISD
ncbi:hypothetical protein [Streptomyces sp. NPDC056361]|uniref:hypothetical protein n=1 Tax=Streptomyces sp. NPDC056361 TaxID=3345795 RepID=UPI0035DE2ADB